MGLCRSLRFARCCMLNALLHPRKRRNTERGPEAGVRGGMYAYTEGGLFPIAISPACLSVCLSVRPVLNCQIIQIKHTHFPAQFSNTPNTRMPPPSFPWATRPIHACCPRSLPLVLGVKVFIVNVFILSIAICQLKTHAQHTRAPTLALR